MAYGTKSTSRWCQTGSFSRVAERSNLGEIEANINRWSNWSSNEQLELGLVGENSL
jgi:hypothetical protein